MLFSIIFHTEITNKGDYKQTTGVTTGGWTYMSFMLCNELSKYTCTSAFKVE